MMKFEAKKISEGINTSNEHPLKELFILLAGVGGLLAVLTLILVLLSDYLVGFISPQTEQQWFDQSGFQFFDAQHENPQAAAVEDYLKQLVDELAASRPEDLGFTINLIEEEKPNAFITPGGHIFVTTGLLPLVDSENALAMVIAHEMAHQYHRHPIRKLGRGIIVGLALMVFVGADGSDWVGDIAASSFNLGLLAYSREQEREADATGMQLLLARYGHGGGGTTFFLKLQQQMHDESAWREYFSTHPNTEGRIQQLASYDSGQTLQPLDESVRDFLSNQSQEK